MSDDAAMRLEAVTRRIEEARRRAGREDPVRLVAVSKGHGVEAIRALYDLGVRDFGESYVQEWQEKAEELPRDIEWHFIGRLQSNKARFLADQCAYVHSVDRRKLGKVLDQRGEEIQRILLQVSLGEEESKGGVDPSKAGELLRQMEAFSKVQVVGLMGIPPYVEDPEENRVHFAALRRLCEELREDLTGRDDAGAEAFRQLSMGMTNDLEVAVEEGATMVRVGTALFGPRSY